LNASTDHDIARAFATLAERRVGALLAGSDAFFFNRFGLLVELASRYSVPALYHAREAVVAGGLVSYGVSNEDGYRLAGVYAGRILRGDKPADLPVELATRIEMSVNLKTAKALGLTVPLTVLARADEVIE